MTAPLSPTTSRAPLRIDTSCPAPALVRVAVAGEADLATCELVAA